MILWNKNSEVFIPFRAYRLINLQGGLMSLWLFKMPFALFHQWIGVPSYPSKCAGETEKIILTFILVDSQKFKTRDSMFSNSRIVFPFYKCGSEHFFTQRNLPCALIFSTAIQNTVHFESVNEQIVLSNPGRQFEHIKRLTMRSLNHIVIIRYKNRCRAKDIQTVHRQV